MGYDSGKEPHTLGDGKVARETEKALLIRIDDKEIWVPKSVIHDDSEVFDMGDNCEGTVVVHRWWAEKNNHA
jgi:hypothetical protein